MKSILLASASIVAFAGAAMAEVTFSGSATLGYNDTAYPHAEDEHDGFYWDGNLSVTLTQELNNGLTARATINFDIADDNLGHTLESKDNLLELRSESSSLQFGDVNFAAHSMWGTNGADLTADNFSQQDGEAVLRGNISYGGVDAAISYAVTDADGNAVPNDIEQLSLGAKASFGNFNFVVAYQEESGDPSALVGDWGDDFRTTEVFGVSVGTSFSGADILLTYANESGTDYRNNGDVNVRDRNSIGVSVSYPIGPVALRGWLASNSDHEDLSYGIRAIYDADVWAVTGTFGSHGDTNPLRWSVEGNYEIGNGITVYAGYLARESWDSGNGGEAYYIGGEMALADNAKFLMSYADAENTNAARLDDEVGTRNYQNGLTAEVTFSF